MGAYEVSLGPTREDAIHALNYLKNNHFIDSSTRGISLEMTLYNPTLNKMIFMRFWAEQPVTGGWVPHWYYLPFVGPEYVGMAHYTLGCAEIILSLFVLFYIKHEVAHFREHWLYYAGNLYNLMDVTIITIFIAMAALRVQIEDQYNELDWSSTEEFVDVVPLTDELYYYRLLMATNFTLSALKLMDPMSKVFKAFGVLAMTIGMMAAELMKSFGLMLLVVYIGFATAKYAIFGELDFNYRTPFYSFFKVYEESLGGFSFAEINPYQPGENWNVALMFVFTLLVVVIMLNLLITILTELSDKCREKAHAEWCLMQATTLNKDEICNEQKLCPHPNSQPQVDVGGWAKFVGVIGGAPLCAALGGAIGAAAGGAFDVSRQVIVDSDFGAGATFGAKFGSCVGALIGAALGWHFSFPKFFKGFLSLVFLDTQNAPLSYFWENYYALAKHLDEARAAKQKRKAARNWQNAFGDDVVANALENARRMDPTDYRNAAGERGEARAAIAFKNKLRDARDALSKRHEEEKAEGKRNT
jgi:hypothetical protein